MIIIRTEIEIAAQPEVCFDLARDLDEHVASAAHTGEEVIGEKRSGLLELGDEVTFRARHFGIRFILSSRITEFKRPEIFVDTMASGPFKSLRHIHEFQPTETGTRMIDTLHLSAPLGPLGWLAERLFLRRHLADFLGKRGDFLKRRAEAVK